MKFTFGPESMFGGTMIHDGPFSNSVLSISMMSETQSQLFVYSNFPFENTVKSKSDFNCMSTQNTYLNVFNYGTKR